MVIPDSSGASEVGKVNSTESRESTPVGNPEKAGLATRKKLQIFLLRINLWG